MKGTYLFVAAAIAGITLAGFFFFPGHTYLQSDTQIYLPILERYWDPTLFSREILAQHPHVSFTIYDEIAPLLRKITGLDFEYVLAAQQIVFRALGILGVFLIATSMGLSKRMALLAASTFALGATIGGPTVLTVEYEPVPRGFAVPLVILAIGLAAHGRDWGAGAAASVAFLYHAPTTLPFWIIYFCMTLWPTRPAIMSRHIAGLLPLLSGVLVLFVFSRLQPGVTEPQDLLSRIGPQLEQFMRMRAPYNWVSMWQRYWFWHYGFLCAVCLVTYLRLRRLAPTDLKFFLAGLPLLGAASIPVSYFLLEGLKWSLVPQVQPARTVLFITALAGILAAVAGLRAIQNGRLAEGIAWLVVCYAVPVNPRMLDVLLPRLDDPLVRRRVAVVVILAAATALAAWAQARARRWAPAPLLVALALPLFLIPGFGRLDNYPCLHTPELDELAHWARVSTPKDAVFVFPEAGKGLEPGIFRAKALRAVYVDWKGGGQVNFLKGLGEEWWRRWQAAMTDKSKPATLARFAPLEVDYIVLRAGNRLGERLPAYSNARYWVYGLQR